MVDNTLNNLQADLIETFLPQVEGKKKAKEVFAKAWEICQEHSSDMYVKRVSEKIEKIKKYCDQGVISEEDARDEVTEILMTLTK